MQEKTPTPRSEPSTPRGKASAPPERVYATTKRVLEVQLHPRRTPPKAGRRHVYVYDVDFEGERIVTGSPDPDFDVARALLSKGITGLVIVRDGRGPRTVVDIARAAKLRTAEAKDRRSRFVPVEEEEE